MKRSRMNKVLSFALSAAMVLGMSAVPAFAAPGSDINSSQEQTQVYTYDAPQSPVSVDRNIITATAHRAASPILGILGLNAKSGFGMINGGAPSDLADAQTRAALGVWGTSINDNPDPYYWNYFYNFYAAENGKALSSDALINANVAASPSGADNNLQEEYGNVSYSLATRPQIVVGCAPTGAGGSDTSGYDGQLATIHSFTKDSPYYQEGDENYSPKLVAYQMTTIKDMIGTVHTLADAVDEVAKSTGQTTRYGDVQPIAKSYEDFVYGTVAYTLSELAKAGKEQKTVAIVLNINEDGTYLIADEDSTSATSVVRAHEYALDVSKNLSDTVGTKGSATINGRESSGVIVTRDELMTADAIITINNNNITLDKLEESFGNKAYNGVTITNTPSALYGVTMNSVENAVGMAYIIGSLYSDTIDINPVELYAYWCEKFLHISDLNSIQKVVQTNFASVILPDGVSATLGSDYSSKKIDDMILEGKAYYLANKADFNDFDDQYIGIDQWNVSEDEIPAPAPAPAFSDVKDTDWFAGAVAYVAQRGIMVGTSDTTFEPNTNLTRAMLAQILYNLEGKPSGGSEPFTDVNTNDWFAPAVAWAYTNGMVTGYNDTTFGSNDPITREQTATILFRYAQSKKLDTSKTADFSKFADASSVSSWAEPAVKWAIGSGLIQGMDDTHIAPAGTATRAQIATILMRYMG